MTHPRTAVRGNLFGAIGMAIAVGAALIGLEQYVLIGVGIGIGAIIGAVLAWRVEMTSMPQLVAAFNGLGGAASVFVAGAFLIQKLSAGGESPASDELAATALTGLIGAITFWGSLIAYGKLQELAMFRKPFAIPAQQIINGMLAVLLLGLTVVTAFCTGDLLWMAVVVFCAIVVLSSLLGILLVNPIGGADMPVVIALLNSYSGLAAAATGFVVSNNVLIISGSLVGASGIILTNLMCKAMNRSLVNVLFGVMDSGSTLSDEEVYANVRSTTADDVALILDTASRVVFVPGYGMAVAQAQHAVRDLSNLLEAKDIEVEYAIHPVAGRMPGHMNVLLAEADVPYEKLKEMDHINPTMGTVDVAIVIGANDVVNPVANTDPQSPIAGMPIIEVEKARTVVVIKRSLSPGFAKIPNPLFAADNALMLFGDGQQAVLDIIAAVKEN